MSFRKPKMNKNAMCAYFLKSVQWIHYIETRSDIFLYSITFFNVLWKNIFIWIFLNQEQTDKPV